MIVTFYSYKGGVGRSMALANVAQWLYLQGARVVMIDWDLEAPGLEAYFYEKRDELERVRSAPGLVDLVQRYRRGFLHYSRRNPDWPRETVVRAAVEDSPLRNYLRPLYGPSHASSGSLHILTAGARRHDDEAPQPSVRTSEPRERPAPPPQPASDDADALIARLLRREAESAEQRARVDVRELTNYEEQRKTPPVLPLDDDDPGPLTFSQYAKAVQSLSWTDLFANFEGQAFVEWLRDQLLVAPGPDGRPFADLVLIDSRTGVTEMGGVCTRVLADLVVTFLAPNQQNLEGSIRIARSVRTGTVEDNRGKRLDVVLVPSRLDDRAETDDLLSFQGQFEQREREFSTPIFRFQDEPAPLHADPTRPASPPPRTTFWPLRIPYFAKFSYKEALTFPVEGSRGRILPIPEMQAIYTRLGACIVAHAPDSPLRRQLAAVVSRELPGVASRILVSHFEDGSGIAAAVHKTLEAAGLDLGPDLSHRGAPMLASSAIAEARALVAVVTPGALSSSTLRDELRAARQHGTLAMLVVADGLTPPAGAGGVYHVADLEALARDLLRAPSKAAERAPNTTPPLPPGYVERSEAQSVAADLLAAAHSEGVVQIALWGPAANGKTVLAQAIAQRGDVYDAFPGGVLWISMSEYARLGQELWSLYTALTGEAAPFKDENEARRRLAERLRDRRVLWILDDLVDAAHAALLPELKIGARIVTTRDLAVARAVGARVVNVGPMTGTDARSVLAVRESEVDAATIDSIVNETVGWPLLLALARDQIAADVGRGVATPMAVANLQKRLARHGVTAFDPWVPESQRVSALIAASVRRLGPALERFGLPALIRISQDDPMETWAERWPVVSGGPPEKERLELQRRLTELALVDSNGRPHPAISRYLSSSIVGRSQPTPTHRQITSAGDRAANPDVSVVLNTLREGRVSHSPAEVKALVRRLKEARYFAYARQYLALARRNPLLAKELMPWLGQQHALCTYKDPDLPGDERLDRALAILDKTDPLHSSDSSETLGIAGAIHKAKWALDGHRQHLEHALAYYRRGFGRDESGDLIRRRIADDSGYTAINAAYVLDLLAGAGNDLPEAPRAALRAEARQLRENIITTLSRMDKPESTETGKPWWFLVTLAEACFGLGLGADGKPDESWYEQARYWIREALVSDHAPWEFESFARQLSSIARLQYGAALGSDSAAMRALRVLLTDEVVVESVQLGKVGLALSGGGFRAALFHIGVLAKLAELDILRRVEALSCVSGGSIIGAYYYLEVKKLLESKRDEAIGRDDYVAIVRSIADQFLIGVQDDVRNRLLGDFSTNLRSMFTDADAQTRRLGDLLETHLFSRVSHAGDVPAAAVRIAMRDLKITPADAPADFAPKLDNWRRSAKVPILVLNATTLNTGHNWQFTATWMGEPPAIVNADIDVNDQLPRVYYTGEHQAPPAYRDFPLGYAVASSAAVPMLFPPLELAGLYDGHEIVQLSDGGVHDNQGIASLLEQDCAVLLVSDASGQLQTAQAPARWRLSVGKRTNDVFMERVRGAEYRELVARTRAGLVRGLVFVHLTEGLDAVIARWIGSQEPTEPPDDPDAAITPKEEWRPTDYGVPRAWQRRLARLRTDLDAFSDLEAYALMWSGYQMTGRRVAKALPELVRGEPESWVFTAVKDRPPRDLEDALSLGERLFGKVWYSSSVLRSVAWIAFTLAILNIVGWVRLALSRWLPAATPMTWWTGTLGELLLAIVAVLATAGVAAGVGLLTWLLCKFIARVRGRSGPVGLWLILAVLSPALKLHRAFIRPIYLERGAMKPRPSASRARAVLAGVALTVLVASLYALILSGGAAPISQGQSVGVPTRHSSR